MRKLLVTTALLGGLAVAGCGPSSGTPSGDASSAQARISSAASAIPSADVAQARADVTRCFPGTPLQQIHTVHLVFLSSSAGKNGPAVAAARARVFSCLGVPPGQRTAFKNDSLTAAEHGKVYTKAGARTYLEVTLPALLAKYQSQGGASIPATGASPVTPTATASS